MSLSASKRPAAGSRRRPAGSVSSRPTHGDSSISSTCSASSCKGTESNNKSHSHPATPRRQAKYGGCSDNHGIRPPAPEQYLTPLQQKEVCIRHLRARLKENVERLQNRESEIGELRMQLTRMQEDWIEEECHRIEAQLALKEARKEIHELHQAVEAVKSNKGLQSSNLPDCKSERIGVERARLGFRTRTSRSCGCSPAHNIGRSATFTRLSSETLPETDRNGNFSEHHVYHIPANRGAATLPRGEGRTRLLLEAALLSEQARSPMLCSTIPRSSTHEKLCSGETVLPIGRPCCTANNCSCVLHACLPHHHLFLHLPQEETPPLPEEHKASTAPTSASEPSNRPVFRSQACSPTMTWASSEEGEKMVGEEELSVITLATTMPDVTLAETQTISTSSSTILSTQKSYVVEPLPPDNLSQLTLSQATTPTVLPLPQIQQPCPRSLLSPEPFFQDVKKTENKETGLDDSTDQMEDPDQEQDQGSPPCHWSRYFLIDLLAVAIPIAPTVAWLCRGGQNDVMPAYPMGSLLRGCCAVALHSLRRVGSSRRRQPSKTGDAANI